MRGEATLAEALGALALGRAPGWSPPRAAAWPLAAGAVLMSVATALCAQAEIRLPFTPVPITGQTFAVALTGAVLGSRAGALAMILYLLEGCAGLPVFAGGAAGAWHLAGPTGGYLLGFIPGAWLAGFLAERGWDRRPLGAFALMLLSSLLVLALGAAGLSRFMPPGALLETGVLPFLPGDLAKAALAAALLPGAWRLLAAGPAGFGARRRE